MEIIWNKVLFNLSSAVASQYCKKFTLIAVQSSQLTMNWLEEVIVDQHVEVIV